MSWIACRDKPMSMRSHSQTAMRKPKNTRLRGEPLKTTSETQSTHEALLGHEDRN